MYSDIVLKISAMIFDLFSKDNMHLCKYLLVQNQPFRLYFIGILFSKTFSPDLLGFVITPRKIKISWMLVWKLIYNSRSCLTY